MKIIYIGGYGRSGSTLLDTVIGNCPGWIGIGEASNIFTEALHHSPCSCGAPLHCCEFWSAHLLEPDLKALNRQQRWAEGPLGCLIGRRTPSYWEFWATILSKCSNLNLNIADSSKVSRATLWRAFNLKRLGADVTVLHLYREPTELLASLLKGSNKDLASGKTVTTTPHLFLLRSYLGALLANLATLVMGKLLCRSYIFISYSDLVSDPSGTLAQIGILEHPPDFTNLDPGHAISGNRMRRQSAKIAMKQPSPSAEARQPFFYRHLFGTLRVFNASQHRPTNL